MYVDRKYAQVMQDLIERWSEEKIGNLTAMNKVAELFAGVIVVDIEDGQVIQKTNVVTEVVQNVVHQSSTNVSGGVVGTLISGTVQPGAKLNIFDPVTGQHIQIGG